MGTQEPASGASGPPRSLRQALRDCAADRLSGVLEVTGEPGGTIYFSGGGVVAIETPGAPGPEVILLRSGRIPEPGWAAAFAAAAAGGGALGPELVARDLIGAGELEAVLRIALADAMFVLSGGRVATCQAEPGAVDGQLALEPPAEVGWLLAETSRRMRVFALLPGLVEHDRDRMAAAPGALPPKVILGHGQDEILALANGRRTPRDMAFALGRGVYATTLQLVHMYGAGLLVTASHRAVTPAGPAPASRPAVAPGRGPRAPESPGALPVRRQSRAQPERDGGPDAGTDLPLRLLRPRSGGE
jgi:hypothetical protein